MKKKTKYKSNENHKVPFLFVSVAAAVVVRIFCLPINSTIAINLQAGAASMGPSLPLLSLPLSLCSGCLVLPHGAEFSLSSSLPSLFNCNCYFGAIYV